MNMYGMFLFPNPLGKNTESKFCSIGVTCTINNLIVWQNLMDLHGNLHEWVADALGVFRGGFYAYASINGTGCQYREQGHIISRILIIL